MLEGYTRPFDPKRPQVRMDETRKQLVRDSRTPLPMTPLPMTPGHVARIDHDYARAGVANLVRCTEPPAGTRWVAVTAQRTRGDGVHQIPHLSDARSPNAEQIVLVMDTLHGHPAWTPCMDTLHVHSPAALDAAFPPAAAKRLAAKLEIHDTPKHGRWHTMADIERRVSGRPWLDRRIPDEDTRAAEVAAWDADRTARHLGVEWRFTTDDARGKLKRRYPSLQE